MKRLLLVGGGHSHLAVLKSFGNAPVRGEITLLSPRRHATYSGMVPGFVAGHYAFGQCRIDLFALAASAGIRIVEGTAERIDVARRAVLTAEGGRLPYDLLSLDVGSRAGEPVPGEGNVLRVRPVEAFAEGWECLRESAKRSEVDRIAVVGGGAAGIEVLLAMRYALSGTKTRFALVSETPVLSAHNPGVRRRIERLLASREIPVSTGRKVVALHAGAIEVEGGARIPAQAIVWAGGAGAPAWLARSGLATDAAGFVSVGETLQSVSHPEIFAAGDCASLIGGRTPKSGVIAVRQGPVLARNLRRALAGAPPEAFREPTRTLALISCGGRYAVASWGRIAFEGAWVWRWKDRIDRRFIEAYRA